MARKPGFEELGRSWQYGKTLKSEGSQDIWAEWVLSRGHSGDSEQLRLKLEHLTPIRDRLLANAHLRSEDVVLDVGVGDGLIAFGALPLVPRGRVIFSDISQDLLDHDREIAVQLGIGGRTDFVRAPAQDLSPIPDASIDVVTARSVLIYVGEKARAFREFHRVLRPRGRVSIFEPINNYFPDDPTDFWGFDAEPVSDLVEKVWAAQEPDASRDEDPMMNFDERDLLRCAEDAGFEEVHIDLVVDVEPGSWVLDWDRLLALAPNPNAKTPGEVISETLTPEEAGRFEAHLRPLVDSGRGIKRSAFAFLQARKA
jgi:ubiquinone/menaquinone biosynthesis C-methylase UbiE